MVAEFSLSCILHCVEKFFQFIALKFLENALNLCIFTHASVLHSKVQARKLKICFQQEKRGGENCDLLYQISIRKHEDKLEH